jgi:hypothetical protein
MSKVIVAHFTDVELINSNNRFDYIRNKLTLNDFLFVTSSFSHRSKLKRIIRKGVTKDLIKVKLCYEMPYNRNTSILRLISHFIFGLNVFFYLIKMRPKLIYCSYPSISLAFFCSLYKIIYKKCKLILDVQDLWPESFLMISDKLYIRFISNYYYLVNNFIFKNIDELVTVSNTFTEYLVNKYKITKKTSTVFIGTDINAYKVNKRSKVFSIVYVGNLSKSYDIKKFLNIYKDINFSKEVIFDIYGTGDDKEMLENHAAINNINVNFKGFVSIEELQNNLSKYSLAVNPIIKSSSATIINKVADYAAAGLPVINTQNSKEYMKYLKIYNSGESFDIDNDQSKIASFILSLSNDNKLVNFYSKGAYNFAKDLFDRNTTYKKIFTLLEN